MASPTTIAPVIAPNFLSGTTDTTYQLHLASDLHNQALIEATTDASYAILRFKTPTQDWALALGGDTSPTDPSGSFYLFDNTDAIAPLWTVTPGTGNTTIKGIVSAQGHEATGNIDIAGMPLGSIALDVAYPIGRLSSKSVNPELGGIQLIGVDNTGRLFTYLGCAEPTVGNQVVAIYAPLQLSAGIDSDVSISGTLDVAGKLTAEGDVGIYGSLGVIGALSVNGPTQLGGGLAGPLELTGDLDVTGNLSAANLHVTGDTIMDGNLQAERADFTGCFVNGSEVLTAADLPPGGIPYPPPGLGISTGSAWEEESIDATNPVFAGTVTANLKMKAMGYLPFDLTKTYVSIGTGNPASPPAVPDIILMNSAAPLDQKITLIGASTTSFFISATQDSGADHAWLWAHRSNYAITALDLIVNSNAGAQTITGAQSGLTIGWHLTGTVGETDFVNNRAGGGGGFNWYNAAPGDVLTNVSAALMKLDASGNLTTEGAISTINAIQIHRGNAKENLNFSADGTVFYLDAYGPDNATNGVTFFRSLRSDASNLINTMVIYGDGSVNIPGSLDGGGNATFNGTGTFAVGISVTGFVPQAPDVLNFSAGGGTAYIDSCGPDASTRGALSFRLFSSTGGFGITPLLLDSAGNATFAALLTVAGNVSPITSPASGLVIDWNIQSGNGETDFINSAGGAGGGFAWYNVPANSVVNSATPITMSLDSLGNLGVAAGCNIGGNFSACGGAWHTDGGSTQLTIGPQYFYIITPNGAGITQFNQNVVVTGFLSVTGEKTFLVPHPLIEGSDLVHACLEGPENGVFYRGEVETTITGQAEVVLPDYFEALTFDDDRSVLLTQVLESDGEKLALLAATRILDGRFHIRSSEGFVRVAWEVKAVRRVGVDRLDVIRDSKEMKQ